MSNLASAAKRKLQVFISSTFSDLQEERQAAVSAVLNAGHIPAGMELFTSGDQSQLEVIKEWIAESDVYMLILGGRYGSIEPVSMLSYTEMEYEFAKGIGKPFFTVVASDYAIDQKVAKIGRIGLELDNGIKLKQFREKVLGSISRFFDEPKDIKLAVHETLQDFVRRRSLIGWVPGNLIIDTGPLNDEILYLKQQVDQLTQEISNNQSSEGEKGTTKAQDVKFSNLESVLKAAKITVPANVAKKGVELTTDLYSYLVTNRNIWVRGITVGPASGERTRWLESNVYPGLIIHRIMQKQDRINNLTMYAIAGEGLDFLAWLDRKSLGGESDRK